MKKTMIIVSCLLVLWCAVFADNQPNKANEQILEESLLRLNSVYDLNLNASWMAQQLSRQQRNYFQLAHTWQNSWDGADWESNLHMELSYNPNGSLDLLTTYLWYEEQWHEMSRTLHIYNDAGSILEMVVLDWNNNTWQNSMRWMWEYDAAGMITSEVSQNWMNDAWVNNLQELYTNDAGLCTEKVTSLWDTGAWLQVTKREYSYFPSGQLQEIIQHVWVNNCWNLQQRISSTWDGTLLDEELFEGWDDAWVTSARNTYSYNADDNLIDMLNEEWENGDWVNGYQHLCTWDGNLCTEHAWRQWIDNDWVNSSRHCYTFDADENMVEDVSQIWAESEWVNELQLLHSYDEITGASQQVVPAHTATLHNYPNPFNPTTTICFSTTKLVDAAEIEIYNLRGQKIRSFELTGAATSVVWDGRDASGKTAPSGLYLAKLKVGNTALAERKMVLLK